MSNCGIYLMLSSNVLAFCAAFWEVLSFKKLPLVFFFQCPFVSVLHGDVHHLCDYGCAVVGSLCVLLERTTSDSVLDWRSDLPGHD